ADDPDRLLEIEDRLHAIQKLCRKHAAAGTTELVAAQTAMAAELEALGQHESRRAGLVTELQAARSHAGAIAGKLTEARRAAAKRLEKAAGEALAELSMAGARVSVAVTPRSAVLSDDAAEVSAALSWDHKKLGPRGWDRIELMLCANKGEEPRPLAKIASGGELSRIMLALKLALRNADTVATYVFDEVDSGIGGATAQVVGSQIRVVANHRQVLCVTHLPQIAAFADQHFHVEKLELAGRTETRVHRLSTAARKDELARMLGGHATSKAKAHAAELLAEAARPRKTSTARA